MKVVDPGHRYELTVLDPPWRDPAVHHPLQFVKREGPKYPGNVGTAAGVQSQEVMRALIDRAQYVDQQEPDPTNDLVIAYLRECIRLLEIRAARRHGRTTAILHRTVAVETLPTCSQCGHIGCEGGCR